MISQKCQYALRAIFELALRHGEGAVKVADVAAAQAIPPRFLEVILSELKHAGIVESRRGATGGFLLVVRPDALTVGQVIRLVEGPIGPVRCVTNNAGAECPMNGDCVFLPLWQRAQSAVEKVYDGTTFADLVAQEKARRAKDVPMYAI